MCFLAFSIYCPVLNFSNCVFCESVMILLSQKSLESFKSISLLLTHLSMYVNLVASSFCCSSSLSLRYFWKFLIGSLNGFPGCLGIALCSQYGLVCALWWVSVIGISSLLAPILASLSASSLPAIFLCALTLCMYNAMVRFCIWCMISYKNNLSG